MFKLVDVRWQEEGVTLNIKEVEVAGEQVFHVVFNDNRKPLTITRMTSFGRPLWTSIPAGRKETEDIGAIIEAHFKGE